jgi:hexulose-6-phosphate isomerase
MNRRSFLRQAAGATVTTSAIAAVPVSARDPRPEPARPPGRAPRLLMSVKFGMVAVEASVSERFELLRDLGYDGVELSSPGGPPADVVADARARSGLPVHGVVNSIHWQQRLSDPRPEVRAAGRAGLRTALHDASAYGGSSVLLVPGRVADPEQENQEQVWERSIEEIRAVLPDAARLGIHILIENVWNGFCYDHDGGDDQSAKQLAAYIDAVNSPWVGAYFDLGNHRRYGLVEEWIHTLGRRIVKLDVKDWSRADGWCKIGDGDVNWPAVRKALDDIGFTGWCTAEVGGGDADRLADILRRMRDVLGA